MYLSWRKNSLSEQRVGAAELDGLYHTQTDWETKGEAARTFEALLEDTSRVLDAALKIHTSTSAKNKTKFKKFDVFSIFLVLFQWRDLPNVNISEETIACLARHLLEFRRPEAVGRSTSGRAILDYFREWRSGLKLVPGVELDSVRSFTSEQRQQMIERDGNKCTICRLPLDESAEADHYPIPHYLGGRTGISNGRMVHARCHVRGRGQGEDQDLSLGVCRR